MLNPESVIQAGGLLLIAAIIFAESGMLLGFFLPGDTLLLSAGVFAAQGKLSLIAVMVVVTLAAIAGDNTGYLIGRHAGHRLFRKKNSLLFRQEYLQRTEKFYERFGSKTMLLAHFIAVIRTFAPITAGIGKMPRAKFIIFDAIGDAGWAVLVTMVGYWFGRRIPNINHYIAFVIALAVIISFGPMLYHLIKAWYQRRHSDDVADSE